MREVTRAFLPYCPPLLLFPLQPTVSFFILDQQIHQISPPTPPTVSRHCDLMSLLCVHHICNICNPMHSFFLPLFQDSPVTPQRATGVHLGGNPDKSSDVLGTQPVLVTVSRSPLNSVPTAPMTEIHRHANL